ncbi:hypothetical protein RDI58_022531 [Solanum bulbocastanum]|uniref:Homeobox domain-containing protein n=1 Tax=Solanum bulbocastanum TaxID=147425 RepID=A0AAN8T857_SOLBU
MEQIQRFFNKCLHPDEDQQKQLGREEGLDHKRVKFWFQNKRTQSKTQNERSVNNARRKEKEGLFCENKAMKEGMENIMCPKCDGRERNLENMKMENQWLTEQVKWMNLFPTIVTKARTIEVLDFGTWGGSIQLMYEKLHILSPLVEARDFFIIHCCRQLDPATWIMVDVSYDIFNEIQSGVPCYSWKFPSGCAIQDMGNYQSYLGGTCSSI